MKLQREWITPITMGSFLLSAVTGVLIFFHLDAGANKFVHEWLSWVLLAGVALHAAVNFNAVKKHLLTRRGQWLLGLFVVLLAVSFVPLAGDKEPPFVTPVRALANAPLATLAEVGKMSPAQLTERLQRAGLNPVSMQQSLSDLAGSDTRKQMRLLGTLLGETR